MQMLVHKVTGEQWEPETQTDHDMALVSGQWRRYVEPPRETTRADETRTSSRRVVVTRRDNREKES